MKDSKTYDSTPNLTPVSSITSIDSLDNEPQVSLNSLNQTILEIYEDDPYIKFKRCHSFNTFHIRRIYINNKLFPRTFIERSYTTS